MTEEPEALAEQPVPDWKHLLRFGYAPGSYMNKCSTCEKMVMGLDKRAIRCRSCAEKLAEQPAELRRLAAVEQERDRLAAEVEALKREDAYVALKANNDALRAEVEALRKERDSITELNHAQYLALENARLLAARHRKEDWAKHMLRFCDGAGVRAVHLRQVDADMKGTPT